MPSRRSVLAAAPLLATPMLLPVPARAQGWTPSRPVRIVVPFLAGGATDSAARIMAERLTAVIGGSFVVENRAGAGGNVGAEAVARAEPDGHTLLMATIGTASINQFLYPNMPFNPRTDFASIAMVMGVANGIVVHPSVQAADFPALMALARSQPGRLTYATPGNGTSGHMSGEYMKFRAQVDITHVPYRGGGPAIVDLVAGNIDMMFDVIPALMPHVREGRFRALAVGSAERVTFVPELRDVPGMAEVLPQSGIDIQSWYAVHGPARTPAPVLARLHQVLTQVARSDEFRGRMEPLGFTPITDESPEAYGRFLAEQERVWQALVEASGASLD